MAFSMRSSLICILTLTGGVMEVKTELSPVAEGVSPDGAIELGGSCEDNPKGCAEGSSCGLVSQLCVSTTSSMAENIILESLKLIEGQQERSRGTNQALNTLEEAIWKIRQDKTAYSTDRVFEAFMIAREGLEFNGEELVAMDKLYDDMIASFTPQELVEAGKLYDDLIASQLVAGTNPVLKILEKKILEALRKVRPDITPDLARRVSEASIAQEGLEDEFDEEVEKSYDDLTASLTPEQLVAAEKFHDDVIASLD